MPSLLSPVVGRLRKPSPQIRLPPGVSQVSGRSQGSGAPVLDTTPRMLIQVWKLCMQMYWERRLLYSSMIFLPLNRGAAPLWHWYSFLHLSLPSFRGSCPIASTAPPISVPSLNQVSSSNTSLCKVHFYLLVPSVIWAHNLCKSTLPGFKSSNLSFLFAHPSPAHMPGRQHVGRGGRVHPKGCAHPLHKF